MQQIVETEQQQKAKICSVMAIVDPAIEIVQDAVISLYGEPVTCEYPENVPTTLLPLVDEYILLFRNIPGSTTIAYRHISTQGSPVHVDTVEKQIHQMLEQGIIEETCSPWMVPAVFVPKKSGK